MTDHNKAPKTTASVPRTAHVSVEQLKLPGNIHLVALDNVGGFDIRPGY